MKLKELLEQLGTPEFWDGVKCSKEKLLEKEVKFYTNTGEEGFLLSAYRGFADEIILDIGNDEIPSKSAQGS